MQFMEGTASKVGIFSYLQLLFFVFVATEDSSPAFEPLDGGPYAVFTANILVPLKIV